MTRLIDADALKKENERLLHCDFPYLSEMTLEELIDEAPTIDAVPVIRCKDCKHSKLIDPVWFECQEDHRVMKADGFCSWAEPRKKKDDC